MFRIPNFYLDEDMNFDEACAIVKGRAGGDLLEGLKAIDKIWEDYLEFENDDDDAFYANWCYEVNAYNVVVEKMRPLFV